MSLYRVLIPFIYYFYFIIYRILFYFIYIYIFTFFIIILFLLGPSPVASPRPNSHLQPNYKAKPNANRPNTITSLLPVLAQAEAFLIPRERPSAMRPNRLTCACDHALDKLPLARPLQHGQPCNASSLCPCHNSFPLDLED